MDPIPRDRPCDLRASDADRERTVELLRDAAADGRLTLEEHSERTDRAYAARTLGELTELTTDLVEPSAQPVRVDARSLVAVFGAEERTGRWVVPARLPATAVFGNITLDLREALLQRREVVINAMAVCGNVTLIVPEGVEVRMSGPPAILGSKTSRVRGELPPGSPVVEVHSVVLCGNVTAKPPPRRWWRGRAPR